MPISPNLNDFPNRDVLITTDLGPIYRSSKGRIQSFSILGSPSWVSIVLDDVPMSIQYFESLADNSVLLEKILSITQ